MGPDRSRQAPPHTWQNPQAPSWWVRKSYRPAVPRPDGKSVAPGSRDPTPLRSQGALGMENLRKLGEEKALELPDCHRHRHPPPSRTATELDDCRRMKKIGGRSAPIRRGARGSRWAHLRITVRRTLCTWDAKPDLSRLAELLA